MIDINRTNKPQLPSLPPGARPAPPPEAPPVLPQDQFAAGPAAKPEAAPPVDATGPAPAPLPSVPALQPVVSTPPVSLFQSEDTPPPSPSGGPLLPGGDLGPGFPSARADSLNPAESIRSFLSKDPTGAVGWTVGKVLQRVSDVTNKGIGIDVAELLTVERMLFTSLSGGIENYTSGTPPLFVALAEGQAAYVNLGPKRTDEADHLMRMFAGLPLDVIEGLETSENDLGAVRTYLLNKAKNKEFPVYVDSDGKCGEPTSTESITTESIASIARRENQLGSDFPDPRLYYKWLVTRIDSNYRRLDPWLFGVKQPLHDKVVQMKQHLTPPWSKEENLNDPFGWSPSKKNMTKAYRSMMEVCGNGQPPTWNTLTDIADSVVGMDRDLLSGIQTYWIKLLSHVSMEQRQTLMTPLSKAWVNLNVLGPQDPHFDMVSPSNAPYIELLDRHSTKVVKERYDRSLALGQAVDHTIAGLGITERKEFLDTLMADIRARQPELEAREARLREKLGDKYHGLDINAILNDQDTIQTPGVKQGLKDLVAASQSDQPIHEMTPDYAEMVRHRDMMDWVATRFSRYGDLAFNHVLDSTRTEDYAANPLILGEFYAPETSPEDVVTALPMGPSQQDVLGNPVEGREPTKVSVVLEGGGGKGFAYVEVLRQIREGLAAGEGQVSIDEYVGNSAGAITAGLLASGYGGDELAAVLQKLDFKKFYSDYLWLSGGVDPKVRGINRTGLFSMQKMYNTLSELLHDKCEVEGRPVLFRDLPFKLRVTSTLMNSDIPKEVLDKLNVQPDGQVVFSYETTPNMDVAAALCCSAAVPGFFNAPQLQVCNDSTSRTPALHRMQMVDGGVVNNFPVSEVSKDEKSFLLMLPAYAQAPNPDGGEPFSLSTLNFDSTAVVKIDEYNRQRYADIKGHLMNTIQAGAEAGYGRVVLGLNLSQISQQTAPVVQGQTRQETEKLLEASQRGGLTTMTAEQGADMVKSNLQGKPHGFWEQNLLNTLMDKNNMFSPKGVFGSDPKYRPAGVEAEGIPELLAGVMGASMTAPSQIENRLFEKA